MHIVPKPKMLLKQTIATVTPIPTLAPVSKPCEGVAEERKVAEILAAREDRTGFAAALQISFRAL